MAIDTSRSIAAVLEWVVRRRDLLDVRGPVDEKGLDRFVEEAARMAAVSGAVAGFGGAATLAVGLSADTVNLIVQHVRVTMAVVYARTGGYPRRPDDIVRIVGRSLGVSLADVLSTRAMMSAVAKAMAGKLGKKALTKVVPVAGAAVGGTLNYRYIKTVAGVLRELPLHELGRHARLTERSAGLPPLDVHELPPTDRAD